MVKSEKIYSPQQFVELVTGNCYVFANNNTTAEIEAALDDNFINDLWNYPLSEIEHIVENKLNVVLVDVSGFNEDGEWVQEYRWFQIPDDFEDTDDSGTDAVPAIEDNEDCAIALFNYLVANKKIKGTAADRTEILHDINNLRGYEWLEIVERTPETKCFFTYLLGGGCEEGECYEE